MNRGVSSGGGQSSLNYLFGGGEAPKAAPKATQAASCETPAANNVPAAKHDPVSPPVEVTKQILAGIDSNVSNNYFRADGQNTGNFITERSSTKVHAAPCGRSSLVDTSLAIVVAATEMFAAI
nr:protein SPIRAL1-like 1 [Tanacetum cinerariifolium]